MSLIHGLPRAFNTVPTDPTAWAAWRDKVLAYRVLVRDQIEHDLNQRDAVLTLAADDPAYDMCIFGSVFEPRDRADRPKGWYPMIPYEFQIRLLRWVEDVMAAMPGTKSYTMGRGDGILEKARGMAGSWTFCQYAAHQWKYSDGFVGGFMSYKQDVVDSSNVTDSLFYKIEGYLGLDARVPEVRTMLVGGVEVEMPIRSPQWMIPVGYDPARHNKDLVIAHPTKTNLINGYATTERTGVGARSTMMVLDEAAKFPAFPIVWNSVGPVTDHRFALSSADIRFGTGFRDLARVSERATLNELPGPAFMRLRPEDHPEQQDLWLEATQNRYGGSDQAQDALQREYFLDYDAGQGSHIYPRANAIIAKPLTFSPANEIIDFCIDPGIRDMTAFHLIKYDPGRHTYGLLASYASNGKPADFYASLVMASPIKDYVYGPDEERIMQWFADYGRHIRFWVGDPAGKQVAGGSATSFYGDFALATNRLSDQRRTIRIWSSDKVAYKQITPRIAALRWLLEQLEFNDTPDAMRTLEAIKEHRFKSHRDDRETTTPDSLPVRTWGHDRVTALEFYACHRKLGGYEQTTTNINVGSSTRFTASGKPWSQRKQAGYGVRDR